MQISVPKRPKTTTDILKLTHLITPSGHTSIMSVPNFNVRMPQPRLFFCSIHMIQDNVQLEHLRAQIK